MDEGALAGTRTPPELMSEQTLEHKAEMFARVSHIDQKRSNGVPYIYHPERVVKIVKKMGVTDESIWAAGWLHDVQEDCGVTQEQLKEKFGDDVAQLVLELTNTYSDHLEFEAKLAATREHASHMSTRAKYIKVADRLDNIMDTDGWKPARILRYCINTRVLMDALDPIPELAIPYAQLILQRVDILEEKYSEK